VVGTRANARRAKDAGVALLEHLGMIDSRTAAATSGHWARGRQKHRHTSGSMRGLAGEVMSIVRRARTHDQGRTGEKVLLDVRVDAASKLRLPRARDRERSCSFTASETPSSRAGIADARGAPYPRDRNESVEGSMSREFQIVGDQRLPGASDVFTKLGAQTRSIASWRPAGRNQHRRVRRVGARRDGGTTTAPSRR